MLTKVGTYTGNGSDARGITGVGFQPDAVFIKGGANEMVLRTSSMVGDKTKQLTTNVALAANMIESLDADGFTIGTDARVNANTTVYYYLAIRDNGDADFDVGSYTGNVADNRSITGIGFQPTAVWVMADAAQYAVWSLNNADLAASGVPDTGANRIQAFESDGFQIGSSNTTNASGATIHYVAFKNVSGESFVSSYTGNNTDNRSLSGVGFQPDFLLIQRFSGTAQHAAARFKDNAGDDSASEGASAFTTDIIQAFESDGFQVGLSALVNANTATYRYLALKEVAAPAAAGARYLLSRPQGLINAGLAHG